MSITLTYNGTMATLSDRLHWADEFDWSVLQARAEDYAAPVPAGVLALFAGVMVNRT